jgi:hypothetical protein
LFGTARSPTATTVPAVRARELAPFTLRARGCGGLATVRGMLRIGCVTANLARRSSPRGRAHRADRKISLGRAPRASRWACRGPGESPPAKKEEWGSCPRAPHRAALVSTPTVRSGGPTPAARHRATKAADSARWGASAMRPCAMTAPSSTAPESPPRNRASPGAFLWDFRERRRRPSSPATGAR